MKKNITSFLVFFFISISSTGQTSHMILVGGNTDIFSPNYLLINAGDTVKFHNIGGYHNVNGTQITYPNNPISFEGPSAGVPWSSNWSMSIVFDSVGNYDYQCDPHVGMGMVGQIIVQPRPDCNGIVNGTSVTDSCGICQQAYIYNFVTHVATFINDTNGLILGPTELLVFPGSAGDPFWNSSCLDCNGIANGTSITDSCGVCQQAYIYNYITHTVTFLNDTNGVVFGPTEILVLPGDPGDSYWNANCSDCNGFVNGTSITDSCGVCQQAYIYNYITHVITFLNDTNGVVLDPTEILVMPADPGNPYWNSSCGYVDCNGIANGTSVIDSCGTCQQAYIYNYISHTVTFLNDTNGLVLGPTEMLVMPGDAGDTYWNSNCKDCNGIVNGLAMVDDCGVCQSALIYNYVTHVATPITDTTGYVFGPTEMLVMPNSSSNPNWNSSCTIDCNGIINGPAITDSCGVCHLAYIYNYTIHAVTYINDTTGLTLAWNELLYFPGQTTSPNWNSCTIDCNGIVNGLAMVDDCGVCQSALIYNYVTHVATPITDTTGYVFGPTEILVMPNSSSNPNWNNSCSGGCTDSTAFNYDPLATYDDGSCIVIIYGCTDPGAVNYYAGANTDDGSCCYLVGCTDPTANNYDPNACFDDNSCTYVSGCQAGPVTGVNMTAVIHNRATFNWDNMNSSTCDVDQMVIRYREVGTSSWTNKFLGNPVGSTTYYGTSKRVIGLTPSTTYEYQFKIWYVGVSSPVNWGANPSGQFTTLDECPNVGNFAVTTPLTTRATFTWDDSNGAYSFVRIKLRVDSISNPSPSDWTNAGGFGVTYGTWTRNKNGLTPGETYRGQSKTWCDPAGGPYKASAWTPLLFWTQPTSVRMGEEYTVGNLEVYPNPSRDVFNISFTSEEIQNVIVRVMNLLGEEIVEEDLQQFVGEYTKQIDLANYTKGVYFLEITTNNGVVNKKLILQ